MKPACPCMGGDKRAPYFSGFGAEGDTVEADYLGAFRGEDSARRYYWLDPVTRPLR